MRDDFSQVLLLCCPDGRDDGAGNGKNQTLLHMSMASITRIWRFVRKYLKFS